jgi:integrase
MAADITVAELDGFVRAALPGTVGRLRAADRLFLEVRRPSEAAPRASWVLRYSHGGKKCSLGLGKYIPKAGGAVKVSAVKVKRETGGVTLAAACEAAVERLKVIDGGVQPVAAKKAVVAEGKAALEAAAVAAAAAAVASERTVAAAVLMWHEETKGALTSLKYAGQRLRRLEEYFPLVGSVEVSKLSIGDIAGAFKALNAKGRPETHLRTSRDLEKAIDWVASQGWVVGANPVSTVRKGLGKRVKSDVGHRAFKVERLAAFSKELAAVGLGKDYPVTERLLQVLALTAARTGEIRLMKWSEIVGLEGDVAAVAHIPVERMKKRVAWSIPLSAQVVGLLREIKGWQAGLQGLKGVHDGFVFVRLEGSYKGRLCSENAVNDLLEGMGWGDELVGHGLRKVFSTVAYSSWPFQAANRTEAIEFSLAHVHKDRVRGTYDLNDYAAQRRALMDWWAGHLELLAQPQAGNVVTLRAAA